MSEQSPPPAQRSLNSYQLASYGAPSMPLSMVSLPLAVYLTPVYADSAGFGLSLAFVGLMLALSRVFDGITDPIIGFLSDRVRTRWGRRKPFVLIGMPIFMLGVYLLWIPPIEFREVTWLGMTFNTGYPYLLGVLVIMYVGATIKDSSDNGIERVSHVVGDNVGNRHFCYSARPSGATSFLCGSCGSISRKIGLSHHSPSGLRLLT